MIKLEVFNDDFFEESSIWLEDSELQFLLNAQPTSKAQRLEWFQNLENRKDYIIKGIAADGQRIGVVGLKNINYVDSTAEYFGYIANRNFRGRSIGKWMLEQAKMILINKGISVVYLHVIPQNYIAINLYFVSGFKINSFDGVVYRMQCQL